MSAHATGHRGKNAFGTTWTKIIIHGSPAKVVDELKRLEEEIPLGYLLASILSHQTLLLLTDEVIPRM